MMDIPWVTMPVARIMKRMRERHKGENERREDFETCLRLAEKAEEEKGEQETRMILLVFIAGMFVGCIAGGTMVAMCAVSKQADFDRLMSEQTDRLSWYNDKDKDSR